MGGSAAILTGCIILCIAWKFKKLEQKRDESKIGKMKLEQTMNEQRQPELHANVTKNGTQFRLSLSLPIVAEEGQGIGQDREWVNDRVLQMLKDPNVQLGIPQKIKKSTIRQNQLSSVCKRNIDNPNTNKTEQKVIMNKISTTKSESNTSHVAELNMQNLAIHQTLMNEACSITMKQQMMRNYMHLAHDEAPYGHYDRGCGSI